MQIWPCLYICTTHIYWFLTRVNTPYSALLNIKCIFYWLNTALIYYAFRLLLRYKNNALPHFLSQGNTQTRQIRAKGQYLPQNALLCEVRRLLFQVRTILFIVRRLLFIVRTIHYQVCTLLSQVCTLLYEVCTALLLVFPRSAEVCMLLSEVRIIRSQVQTEFSLETRNSCFSGCSPNSRWLKARLRWSGYA